MEEEKPKEDEVSEEEPEKDNQIEEELPENEEPNNDAQDP